MKGAYRSGMRVKGSMCGYGMFSTSSTLRFPSEISRSIHVPTFFGACTHPNAKTPNSVDSMRRKV